MGAGGIIGAQIIPFFEAFCIEYNISIILLIGVFTVLTAFAGFGLEETFNKGLK